MSRIRMTLAAAVVLLGFVVIAGIHGRTRPVARRTSAPPAAARQAIALAEPGFSMPETTSQQPGEWVVADNAPPIEEEGVPPMPVCIHEPEFPMDVQQP